MKLKEFQKHLAKPQIFVALCYGCQHKHRIEVIPGRYSDCFSDWRSKHSGPNCMVKFRRPRRVPAMKDNADIKIAFGASAAYTITVASLASDTNLLAGRESDGVSNASNKYIDFMVAGKIRTGTSPTASRKIEVWGVGALDDTPTYPDVFDGTDSNETVTAAEVKNSALALLAIIGTNATSSVDYPMHPTSLFGAFGGIMPVAHGIFVVHNTAVNLDSTGGNHFFKYTPQYYTSI